MSNVIALCVGFCAVVLFTYLLRSGALGGASYATLVIAAGLVSVAISRIDVLQVLDLKNLSVTLREIQQVRADVYAKADSVKRMGEELASLVVFNAARVGRLTGDDLTDRLIEVRDQTQSMLKDIGSNPARVEETLRPLNDIIIFDLKADILRYLMERLGEVSKQADRPKVAWAEIDPEFRSVIMDRWDRPLVVERAKRYRIYDETLEKSLDALDDFIKTTKQ
jgi:hypothetical protein